MNCRWSGVVQEFQELIPFKPQEINQGISHPEKAQLVDKPGGHGHIVFVLLLQVISDGNDVTYCG